MFVVDPYSAIKATMHLCHFVIKLDKIIISSGVCKPLLCTFKQDDNSSSAS